MKHTYNLIWHPVSFDNKDVYYESWHDFWGPCLAQFNRIGNGLNQKKSVTFLMGKREFVDTSMLDAYVESLGWTIKLLENTDFPPSDYYEWEKGEAVFYEFSHPEVNGQQILFIGQLYKFWYGDLKDYPIPNFTSDIGEMLVCDHVEWRPGSQPDGSFLHRLSHRSDNQCVCTFNQAWVNAGKQKMSDMLGDGFLKEYGVARTV